MTTTTADVERLIEAEDGVVEVGRVVPLLTAPWAVLPPGPRRWVPTDLSVEPTADGTGLDAVRMTYRAAGDRTVVVAGAVQGVDLDDLTGRLARPLVFAFLRRELSDVPPHALALALECDPVWGRAEPRVEGWVTGTAGRGDRPVRIARRESGAGALLVASQGVAPEELATVLAGLQPVASGGGTDDPTVAELHVRHRRALAQRWWDAPRTPWATRPTE